MIKNHSFIDGNKRIGILAMMTFLQLNGLSVDCSDEELIHLGLGLASGEINYKDLLMCFTIYCVQFIFQKEFFSLCLTQAEKVKAYLITGARKLSIERVYPNPTLGYGLVFEG